MDDPIKPKIPRSRRWSRRAILLVLFLATAEAGRRAAPWIRREVGLQRAWNQIETGRIEEAEIQLDRLISENPRDTRARLALVELYRRAGRITEAEETLQRAVELGLPIEAARPEHNLLRPTDLTTPATAEQRRARVNR